MYIAAAAVALAGMLHLMLAPGNLRFNVNEGILFAIGGTAQVFWIIPMIRRRGRVWYSIGIAGNIAFFGIWLITRFPGNPITGRGEMRINSTEVIIEIAQLAFVGITSIILVLEARKDKKMRESNAANNNNTQTLIGKSSRGNRGIMILGVIVAAMVLTSWFVLPTLTPRRGAGPSGGLRESLRESGSRAPLTSDVGGQPLAQATTTPNSG
jgi:hypothetical protein